MCRIGPGSEVFSVVQPMQTINHRSGPRHDGCRRQAANFDAQSFIVRSPLAFCDSSVFICVICGQQCDSIPRAQRSAIRRSQHDQAATQRMRFVDALNLCHANVQANRVAASEFPYQMRLFRHSGSAPCSHLRFSAIQSCALLKGNC